MKRSSKSFHTLSVHAGGTANEHKAVTPPIYQTSTFRFDSAEHGAACFAGEADGYIYTRMGNPTVEALESALAELEGGAGAQACGSGMAAIHTVMATFAKAGGHIVCGESVYGPVTSLLQGPLKQLGIRATFVDSSDTEAVAAAIEKDTTLVHVETPGNPTLVVTDLAAVAKIAHDHGAKMSVDNTFLTPVLQRPLDLGADIVVHSLTKFLNGHADVVGGAIISRTEEDRRRLRKALNLFGGVLPPMESYFVLRGMRTLALRMERHCASALELARRLESRPDVDWVRYPWLESHPQHELSRRQSRGGGGVISFELKGGLEAGRKLMNTVELCQLAVSLGGVETLIQHPASMTHAGMTAELRRQAGISDGLVRISVGIEEAGDVIADIEDALDRIAAGRDAPALAGD